MSEDKNKPTLDALAEEIKSSNVKLEEASQKRDQIVEGLSAALEQQKVDLKEFGKTREETASEITKLGKQMEDVVDEMKSLIDKRVEEMEEKLEEERKARKRPGWDNDDFDPEEQKTIGQRFVEMLQAKDEHGRSEADRMAASERRDSRPLTFKSVYREMERKADLTIAGLTGRILPEMRIPGLITREEDRGLTIRDLLNVTPTDQQAVTYIEETGFYDSTAALSVTLAQSAGTATATTGSAHGLRPGQRVKIAGADQEEYNGNHTIKTVPSSTTYTFEVDSGATSPATGTITSQPLFTGGAAATQTEGEAKAEATLEYEEKTVSAKTIAHWIPASKQILSDWPQLRSLIDNRLLYGLKRKEEQQLLYGTGSGNQIQGILTHANRQEYSWSTGTTGDTKLDAIRRAITRSQHVEYEPDGLVLSYTDWEDIELLKGSDEHYVWLSLPDAGGVGPRVWRLPVALTNAISDGDFVLGSFGRGAELFDREQAMVRFSEHHASFFTSNMVAVLAEMRAMLAIYRPESFVHGTFDSAPA